MTEVGNDTVTERNGGILPTHRRAQPEGCRQLVRPPAWRRSLAGRSRYRCEDGPRHVGSLSGKRRYRTRLRSLRYAGFAETGVRGLTAVMVVSHG